VPAKLGEMLLRAGALNEAQLDQVLTAQAVYGGRLGTNLVEMGMIDEDELVRLLHEKLGVPCLDPVALDNLPEEIINTIPREMVSRYHVLPVALEGKRLTLAMADPSDSEAINEIGFVTGLAIVPRVCSELRMTVALERYCGIKRATRYIPSAGAVQPNFAADSESVHAGGVPGGASAATTPDKSRVTGTGKRSSLETLSERLATSSDDAQVVSALLSYLGAEFDTCSFWGVKRGQAVGIRAVDAGMEVADFAGSAVTIDKTEQLKRVVQEKRLFMGLWSAHAQDDLPLKSLGVDTQAPILLVPLSIEGQVAAVICVTDSKGRLAAGAFELQRVATMTALALEMLCLKKRIRSV
jgi:hypothetical protein